MTETPRAAHELLAQRARQLARPLDGTATDGALAAAVATPVLIVRIGSERIAIALDHITEVYRTDALTPIPGARPPIVGVIAWRGRVLTVLDIAQGRVGPIALGDTTRVLVIGQRRASFGVVADDVEDVQDVDMLRAAPVDDVAPTRRDFVRGVMPDALIVLDAAALITRYAPTH